MLTHNKACAIFTIPQLLPVVKEAIKDLDLPHNIKVTTLPPTPTPHPL